MSSRDKLISFRTNNNKVKEKWQHDKKKSRKPVIRVMDDAVDIEVNQCE